MGSQPRVSNVCSGNSTYELSAQGFYHMHVAVKSKYQTKKIREFVMQKVVLEIRRMLLLAFLS